MAALLALSLTPAAALQTHQVSFVPATLEEQVSVDMIVAGAKNMIVCNEGQARSFLAFIAIPAADRQARLRAIKGGGPASDGRLCDVRLLDRVKLGDNIADEEVNGHHWVARWATREEAGKTYRFVVVGTDDHE